MLPSSTSNNVVNGLRADPIALRYADFRASRLGADRSHIGLRQFRGRVFFTAKRPPLSLSIRHVFAVGAEPQMLDVPTKRIVATMADVLPIGDRAISQLPSQPCHQARFTLPFDKAVSVSVGASSPRPARIGTSGLVSVVVKPLGKRPVQTDAQSFRFGVSHSLAPFQRLMVRAGVRAATRPGSHFTPKGKM